MRLETDERQDIELRFLRYRWEIPNLVPPSQLWATKARLDRCYEREFKLKHYFDDLLAGGNEWAALLVDMRDNGMVNPLILRDVGDGVFYTIIGNQRLMCARVLDWHTVSCVFAGPDDSNTDGTKKVRDYERMFWNNETKQWQHR